jgi:nucleoside-triphosphatase THEP1
MYALHSVPPRSASARPQQALVAIVYANEAYPQSTFERIVEDCRRRGLRIAGVLQHPVCPDAAGHCDVALEELTTGLRTDLFEDRGPGAGGCRLDVAALAEVNAQVARTLDADPELLVLNKFGKVEAEGRGLLDLVAMAVDRGIPVVIGVPIRNLAAWRNFAGGMSVEFTSDPSEVSDWLNRSFPLAVEQSPEPAAC